MGTLGRSTHGQRGPAACDDTNQGRRVRPEIRGCAKWGTGASRVQTVASRANEATFVCRTCLAYEPGRTEDVARDSRPKVGWNGNRSVAGVDRDRSMRGGRGGERAFSLPLGTESTGSARLI